MICSVQAEGDNGTARTTASHAAATRQHHQRRVRPRGVVFILVNMLMLVGLIVLDVRDLYYKTKWIGPYDSYAFDGVGDHVLDEIQLIPAHPIANGTIRGRILERTSGWSSFLDPCDAMFGTSFFLSSLGVNCTVGGPIHPVIVPKLVLSGTIRVDSVAWACCQLLFFHRRPGVCQERVVTGFLSRYAMEAPHLQRSQIARAGSSAEDELLHLLSVISQSDSLARVVCVEAFELSRLGLHQPTIFGCGSGSVFAAALAGIHATQLKELLHDKAWLTLDEANIMGLRFAVRQNDKSDYIVRHTTSSDGRSYSIATHHPQMNFSSSGHMFALLILIDLFVFLLLLLSSFQIFRVLLLPQLRFNLGYTSRRVAFFRGSTWMSVVSRSLNRSRGVAALSIVSHLISWQLMMPNSLIWSWTQSHEGRVQAILTSLRASSLIPITFIWLWDFVVVVIGEHAAYAVTKRTFISMPEMLVCSTLIAIALQSDFLSMSSAKYARDNQRLSDFASFTNAGGYSNAYDDDNDPSQMLLSSAQYWEIVYAPLARLLAASVAASLLFLLVKMALLRHCKCRCLSRGTAPASRSTPRDSIPYERLPVETVLDQPIRAKSLLRFRMEMELPGASTMPRFLYAPLYFDYGTLVDRDGNIVRRRGFLETIPPCIDLTTQIPVNGSTVLTGSTLSGLITAHTGRGGGSAPVRKAFSTNLLIVATQRASLRFMGQSDEINAIGIQRVTPRSIDAAPHRLTQRWAQRRMSFNVPVH